MSSDRQEQRDAVDRMNEYRELREYVRQLRQNVLEMDDLLDEMQWVAAGGRGAPKPERMELLREANERMIEDLEALIEEAPNPYEVRDEQ